MNRPKQILVIDDDSGVREALVDLLEVGGYESLAAADGLTGLELFRKHRERIALVMLDLQMPGMKGEDTLAALRGVDPEAPILVMSGYDENEVFRRVGNGANPYGMVGYLQKPFEADDLLDRLGRML